MLVKEHISESFREESDPVRDMGIGMNAEDIFFEFIKDYNNEFNTELHVSSCGEIYNVKKGTVLQITCKYEDVKSPANRIIADESGEYGLLFVTTDESARQIFEKNDATWGFFYEMGGTRKKLKSIYLKDVVKELLKIRKFNKKILDSSIKKYKRYIIEVEKMKEILNAS